MPVRRNRSSNNKGKQSSAAAVNAKPTTAQGAETVVSSTKSTGTTVKLPQENAISVKGQEQHQAVVVASTVNTDTNNNHDNSTSSSSNNNINALILTSEKRRGVYECDYCGIDISQTPRIRCAICIVDFDICCDCYSTIDPITAISQLQHKQQQLQQLNTTSNITSNTSTTVQGGSDNTSSTTTSIQQQQQHDPLTHGYRVCDSTRYPLFPINSAIVTALSNSTNTTFSDWNINQNKKRTSSKDDTTISAMIMDGIELYEKEDIGKSESKEDTTVLDGNSNSNKSEDQNRIVSIITTAGDDTKTIWTIEEDLRLLYGIQTYGLGNWIEISEAVMGHGSYGKTPKRCMERYFDDYMGRYGYIVPQYTLVHEAIPGTTTATTTSVTNPDTDDDADTVTLAGRGTGNDRDNTTTTTPSKDNTANQGTSANPTTTIGESAIRTSKRRSTMFRPSSSNTSQPVAKKYVAVLTETLPEYQSLNFKPFLPQLQSGAIITIGQEVGRDQATKAELAYARTIAGMDSKEQVERIRADWEMNRLNKPGGPTVLPMRPDDIPRLPGSELVGFMPRRGDFDIEYDNNAEDAIADMEFTPGESEQDRNLKLAVLAIYNTRLEERAKRKQFILSRKLYDYRAYQEEYRKLPRDERDLVLRMRLFERFHTPEEHKVFISDLLKAKRLRKEIAKLQMYRRIGIRTQLEAERYEIDKARRLFHKNAVLQKKEEEKKGEHSGSTSGVSGTGSTTTNNHESLSSQYWKQYRTTDRRVRRSVNRGGTDDTTSKVENEDGNDTVGTTTENEANLSSTNAKMDIENDDGNETVPHDDMENEKLLVKSTDDAMEVDLCTNNDNDRKNVAELSIEDTNVENDNDNDKKTVSENKDDDLTHLPGYHQLSVREVDLIRSIQITPQQYIAIKKALIYESLQRGLLENDNDDNNKSEDVDHRRRRNSVGTTTVGGGNVTTNTSSNNANSRTLFMLDIERRGKVVDFILHAGWITTQFGKSLLSSS